MYLYVNNTLSASVNTTGWLGSFVGSGFVVINGRRDVNETNDSRVGITGVISKPIIFNRVLTNEERSVLFENPQRFLTQSNWNAKKGSDLRIKITEAGASTGTINKVTAQYKLI